jgi:hypothetical protein
MGLANVFRVFSRQISSVPFFSPDTIGVAFSLSSGIIKQLPHARVF